MGHRLDRGIAKDDNSIMEDASSHSIEAAHDYCVENLSIKWIAELHHVSQATLSRRLAEARESVQAILGVQDGRVDRFRTITQPITMVERLREDMNEHGAGIWWENSPYDDFNLKHEFDGIAEVNQDIRGE